MGAIGKLAKGVGAVLAVLLAIGGIAYAMDAKLSATVVATRCAAQEVDVETDLFHIDYTAEVPRDNCILLQPGNYVQYFLRSQRVIVFDERGGDCLYDSAKGVGCGVDDDDGGGGGFPRLPVAR